MKMPKKTIIVASVIFSLILIGKVQESKLQEQQAEQEKVLREAKEKQEQNRREEFNTNRNAILKEISQLINSGEYTKAKQLTAKYAITGDLELTALRKRAEEMEIVAQLKKIPADQTERNLELYEKLTRLAPENKKYRSKQEHYQGIIDKQKKESQDRIAKYGEPPVQSPWDGSYRPVETYLEKTMHNPDSLKMDGCTKVYHTKSGWLVGCQFRGSNAFGAIVRNARWFTIIHDVVIKVDTADKYNW